MIKLVEVIQTLNNSFKFREIYINPDHVVLLREDLNMKGRLDEGKYDFPEGLDVRQSFTKIQLFNGSTGSEFVVVGTPNTVETKLKGAKKELLHG